MKEQNRELRNEPFCIWSNDLPQSSREHNRKKMFFSKNNVENWVSLIKLDYFLEPYVKNILNKIFRKLARRSAQACNPSTLGGQGRRIMKSGVRDQPGQHGETLSSTKIQKISQAWWWVPVVPDTQEAEAGESLESRRRSLQWAEIMPLHFSLLQSKTLS